MALSKWTRKELVKGLRFLSTAVKVDPEWDNARPFEEIPGPKPIPVPVVGNMWRFLPFGNYGGMDLGEVHQKWHKEFGPIMRLTGAGFTDQVFLFDPSFTEKMFRNDSHWPVREGIESLKYYREKTRKDVYGGYGLVSSQNEQWQKVRSAVNQPMMQPRNAKMYVQPISEVSEEFIQRMKFLRDSKLEMPKDFQNELNKWALESIAIVALDTRLGCLQGNLSPDSEAQRMIESVHTLFQCMYKLDLLFFSPWKYINTPTWSKLVKASDTITETTLKYINKKMDMLKTSEKSDEHKSILEAVLLRSENSQIAVVMVMDMLTAGIDTTSNATGVLLYHLAKNPEKQEKLFQEIKSFLPNKNSALTSEILDEMKYLKACVKESMRLAPVVIGTARTATKDYVIGGYRIPKGVQVVTVNMLMSRMEQNFEQPKEFIPERWLRSKQDAENSAQKTHPYVFLPFGFGSRMCVGRRFAELEIEILTTKILQNFIVEYNYGEMTMKTHILNEPSKPLQFTIKDRIEGSA